jgi:hypothetical protein
MPNLASHQSATTTKLLLIGDPGSGKTGALASLASAGYQLRILDFDNGLDVLKNLLSDPKTPYDKKAINNVTYMTVTDEMKNVAGKLIPSKATAWSQGIQMLQHWKEPIRRWSTWLGSRAGNLMGAKRHFSDRLSHLPLPRRHAIYPLPKWPVGPASPSKRLVPRTTATRGPPRTNKVQTNCLQRYYALPHHIHRRRRPAKQRLPKLPRESPLPKDWLLFQQHLDGADDRPGCKPKTPYQNKHNWDNRVEKFRPIERFTRVRHNQWPRPLF